MQKKGYKGRCEKRMLPKCQGICRTFSSIQYVYADILQNDDGIKEIKCNVLLDGLAEGEYWAMVYNHLLLLLGSVC